MDHERIEELLAGYVLLALSGEDAIEADRLLSEHVPTCPMCRETLAGFQVCSIRLKLVSCAIALLTLMPNVAELMLAEVHRDARRVPGGRGRASARRARGPRP